MWGVLQVASDTITHPAEVQREEDEASLSMQRSGGITSQAEEDKADVEGVAAVPQTAVGPAPSPMPHAAAGASASPPHIHTTPAPQAPAPTPNAVASTTSSTSSQRPPRRIASGGSIPGRTHVHHRHGEHGSTAGGSGASAPKAAVTRSAVAPHAHASVHTRVREGREPRSAHSSTAQPAPAHPAPAHPSPTSGGAVASGGRSSSGSRRHGGGAGHGTGDGEESAANRSGSQRRRLLTQRSASAGSVGPGAGGPTGETAAHAPPPAPTPLLPALVSPPGVGPRPRVPSGDSMLRKVASSGLLRK